MTFTLPIWCLPLGITIVIWLGFIVVGFWPRPYRGSYDFTGALLGILYLFLAVVATLITWLIYFILV